jgi:hypothetical protein
MCTIKVIQGWQAENILEYYKQKVGKSLTTIKMKNLEQLKSAKFQLNEEKMAQTNGGGKVGTDTGECQGTGCWDYSGGVNWIKDWEDIECGGTTIKNGPTSGQ